MLRRCGNVAIFRSGLLYQRVATISTRSSHFQQQSREWLIWAPLFTISTGFLLAVISADYNAELRQTGEGSGGKRKHEKNHLVGQDDDSWTQPLVSLFGLDTPATVNEEHTEDKSGWRSFRRIRNSFTLDSLPSINTSWIWPESVVEFRSRIQTLLLEVGRGPGSLYAEVLEEAKDAPEANWEAHVRLGDELCLAERAYLRERKRRMKNAFAKFIGVQESEVAEEDIPIVAIAASGGGYRAMTNTTGSLVGAKESGLLDCITYMAGISGSCWALGTLYSGIPKVSHPPDPRIVAEHIKDRVSKSFFDVVTLELLTNKPTNKYLLSGLILKANAPHGAINLIDIYGILISSRLFIPSDIQALDSDNLSLHKFRRFVDDGSMPLPIFTAIQHEIPHETEKPLEQIKEQRDYLVDQSRYEVLQKEEEELQKKTRWLWYEFTPYEVGCDELGAWIPSWSFGRQFNNGKSVDNRPELSFTILAGIYASAFCATLRDYFHEAQPILRQLPWALYSWLAEIIKDNEEDFGAIHPVVPNQLPNFVRGLDGQLRDGSPKDITSRDTLGFMDAGAELNIPYYPLLRRDVDCIIALDASADSQDLWFTRAEEYATRKGVSTWPKGARWPVEVENGEGSTQAAGKGQEEDSVNRRLAEEQESQVREQAERRKEQEKRTIPPVDGTSQAEMETTPPTNADEGSGSGELSSSSDIPHGRSLEACLIWIGSSKDTDAGQSRFDDLTDEELAQRDGIGIVYMPLIPNAAAAADWDPSVISTWRREMDPNETEKLLSVAKANFLEGDPKIRKLLKAMWIRKRRERQERQKLRQLKTLASSLHRHLVRHDE